MLKTKYFMFSNGSYSDYCVGGMYKTSKDMPADAWKLHVRTIKESFAARKLALAEAFCEREGYTLDVEDFKRREFISSLAYHFIFQNTDEWKALHKEIRDTDITQSFIDKWKLIYVEYEECHEGDY